jgi:Zn-finger nucleic acid-binding protein
MKTATVIKGLVKGVDSSMISREVNVADSLTSRGGKVTRAQTVPNEHGKDTNGVILYIVFDQPLTATVMLKAFGKADAEVGRCLVDVTAAKDEAALLEMSEPGICGKADAAPAGMRPCPICGTKMRRCIAWGAAVDVCNAHGIWLDGELPAILAARGDGQWRRRLADLQRARRDGKVAGALLGMWSLLLDD